MKLPARFRLRTLLIAIALLSVPMGWIAYQLNWIRERRAFVASHLLLYKIRRDSRREIPWALKLFGEQPLNDGIAVDKSELEQARGLFPELRFIPGED